MKALVYDDVETLTYRDVPDPEPRAGEHLIRIEASGICGSDMHAYLGHDERRPAPLVLGHEAAGVVVGGARDGARVTLNPLATCGTCSACASGRDNLCRQRAIISMPPREGAFAQMVAMPEQSLVVVPDDVPLHKAALAEPLACGWHAVRLGERVLDKPVSDAKCLVLGGGAIGVGSALALRAFGAAEVHVAEPNETRHTALDRIEGVTPVRPGQITDVDLVIDAVGYAATRADASAVVRPGGVIMHIGLGDAAGGLDIRRMTLQEITFIGTYAYTTQDFRDTAQAIFDGRLGPLDWTEQRSLADGPAAFADIRAGRVGAPKIILEPK